MAAAAVAPWPLGLTGAVYGIAAALLSGVFALLARAGLAQPRDRPEGDGAGEAAVRLLRSSISSRSSARWSLTMACRMTPQDEEEVRRRQRSRAILMAVLLIAFVVLVYAISIAKMGLAGG